MPVLDFHPDQLLREYGIDCKRIFPNPGLETPFGATYCKVEPGQATVPHRHHEGETFYVVEGRGTLHITGEASRTVGQGDVVYLPSETEHQIMNEAAEPLLFYSVWWEDPALATNDLPKSALVYTAPPTPNGDLHLGHLSGPYVAADVMARYLRQRRVDARLHTGTDDNQSYVAVKGQALGITPEAVTERFGDRITATLAAVDVDLQHMLRPTRTPAYVRFVQDFFVRLREAGSVQLRAAASLHCATCDLYLYEAHVSGLCPHCGAGTNGNGCEACYQPNDCVDLIDPVCNHCHAPATVITVDRWYFPLDAHRSALATFHDTVAMGPHLRSLASGLLAETLPEISVSHVADWGIPVPGQPGQVLYEWFEMAAGFLYSAQALSPDGTWEHFWKGADAEVVQCFGFDNAFFFVVFLPAVLTAYAPDIRLPSALVGNEFYRLEGTKFSTSRNHAVWGDQALAHVPADVLRYFLAYDRPQFEQTSFSLSHLRQVVERDLVGQWGAWLAELDLTLTAFDGMAPGPVEPAGLAADQKRFLARLNRINQEVATCYTPASVDLRRAARLLGELVTSARDFHAGYAHLQANPAARAQPAARASVALELAAVKTLANTTAPLMPTFAAHLRKALGEPVGEAGPVWLPVIDLLPAGRTLGRLQTETFAMALNGVDTLIGATATAGQPV